MTAAYVVLGLGNRIESDEALGALVIEQLTSDPSLLAGLPDPGAVDLIDGGTVGLALIPHLVDLDGLIVIDVISAGTAPGTLIDLDGSALMRKEQQVMSVHDLGAGELLGALFLMDAWPRRVRVVGLEPKMIELGVDLTPEVAAGVPALLEAVVAHLATWQREDAASGAEAGTMAGAEAGAKAGTDAGQGGWRRQGRLGLAQRPAPPGAEAG
jgi:hydrogenase maturation protease